MKKTLTFWFWTYLILGVLNTGIAFVPPVRWGNFFNLGIGIWMFYEARVRYQERRDLPQPKPEPKQDDGKDI